MRFVDTLVVARLGSDHVEALTIALALFAIPQTFMISFTSGTGIIVSNYLGASQPHRAWLALQAGAITSTLLAFFGVATVISAPVALSFISPGASPSPLSTTYYSSIVWALPAQTLAALAAHALIAFQRPGLVLTTSFLVNALNLFLSIGLALGKFGFPKFGIAGAAFATVIASSIQAALMIGAVIVVRPRKRLPSHRKFPPRRQIVKCLRTSIPIAVEYALDITLWGILLVWLVGKYGNNDLAAAAVILRCYDLVYIPTEGFSISLSSVLGRAVGARNSRQVRNTISSALKIVSTYLVVVSIMIVLFAPLVFEWFELDPHSNPVGIASLRLVGSFLLFDGLVVVYAACFRSIGLPLVPLLTNLVGGILFLLVGGLIVTTQLSIGTSFTIWCLDICFLTFNGLILWLFWSRSKIVKLYLSSQNRIRKQQ